jgi:hypothetical protein
MNKIEQTEKRKFSQRKHLNKAINREPKSKIEQGENESQTHAEV